MFSVRWVQNIFDHFFAVNANIDRTSYFYITGKVISISYSVNICLPEIIAGTYKKSFDKKVRVLLQQVGLEGLEHKKVNHLSGGQRQRVAICRALAMDAEVIVADEPTGALDLSNTESLMDLLERLNKQGITVIIVTHDPYVANRCTMEYVIEDGKLSKHA